MYKVLVIGDPKVGKTSLVHRLVNNTFKEAYKTTLGVDFALKTVSLKDGSQIKIQLWDIAGQERGTSMTRVYYKGASACLLVFDLTDRESFENCSKWKQDLDTKVFLSDDQPIPCLLLGNKVDLTDQRTIQEAEMKKLSNDCVFIGCKSCSVKENQGVDEAVDFLTTQMLQRCKKLTMSSDDNAFSVEPKEESNTGGCCRAS